MTDDFENRRQYPRFKAPICYRSAPFFSSRRQLVNIGLGGIRIYSNDKLKVGKRLEIELLLPDDEILTFIAKIVWQKPLQDSEIAQFDVGLQFLDAPEDTLQRLREVLEKYTDDKETDEA